MPFAGARPVIQRRATPPATGDWVDRATQLRAIIAEHGAKPGFQEITLHIDDQESTVGAKLERIGSSRFRLSKRYNLQMKEEP